MQPCVGSPWLARHCPHGSSNVQLVPRIHCGASSERSLTAVIQCSCSLQQQHRTLPGQRAATAAAGCSSSAGLAAPALHTSRYASTSSIACRSATGTATAAAAAPTAPLPMEQHDPDPTKARLHALYRFVMDNGRLPKVAADSILHLKPTYTILIAACMSLCSRSSVKVCSVSGLCSSLQQLLLQFSNSLLEWHAHTYTKPAPLHSEASAEHASACIVALVFDCLYQPAPLHSDASSAALNIHLHASCTCLSPACRYGS